MLHPLIPVFVVALLGGSGGGPEIVNAHGTYGHLGAPRPKGVGMLPGDVAHVTFEIKGLKADKNGKVKYSIAIVIHDAAGKVVFEQKPYKAHAQHFFGGDTIQAAARIDVPLDIKAGPIDWKVTVTDRTTEKSTELKGQGKILPPDFGLVQVGTFADAEDRVPTPPVGVVGGQLYLSFGVVGFARQGQAARHQGQPAHPRRQGPADHCQSADRPGQGRHCCGRSRRAAAVRPESRPRRPLYARAVRPGHGQRQNCLRFLPSPHPIKRVTHLGGKRRSFTPLPYLASAAQPISSRRPDLPLLPILPCMRALRRR